MRSALVMAPLLVALSTEASELQSRGLLPVRGQFPLDLISLDFTPAPATLPARGAARVQVLLVHGNTFEKTPDYESAAAAVDGGAQHPSWDFLADAETTRFALGVELQPLRRLSLGIEVPLLRHGGGFADSTIEEFHDLFSLPQNGREAWPRDEMRLDVLGRDGRRRLADGATGLGDVTLRARVLVRDRPGHAIAVAADLKAPTGDDAKFAGSGAWDVGAGLLLTAGSDRHLVHAGLGHQVLGQPDGWPMAIRDRTSAFAGYEFAANERWAVVAHVMGATSVFPREPGREQHRPRAELALGFHWTRGPFRLSSGFVENLTTSDNDVDLAGVVGLGWDLRARR